jgi:hypothetical protein
MGLAIGIGIGITSITGNSVPPSPSPFFEILAESGDYLISESGASPTFLITEQ